VTRSMSITCLQRPRLVVVGTLVAWAPRFDMPRLICISILKGAVGMLLFWYLWGRYQVVTQWTVPG
jgi:hypothetical protein